MNQRLADDLLSRFADLLAEQMGLHFGPERRADLQRGLEAASRELGLGDTVACVNRLMAGPMSPRQFGVLARHLTVGETYFFRDKRGLEILETEILPGLIQGRRDGDRRLRLWSAGCATGEEAYSLAILLTRTIPDWPQWAITVLGTDINPQALEQAARGVYGEWSFRDAPPWLKDRYFQPVAQGRYRLVPQIQQMVTFATLNLASDLYPSLLNNTNAMDLIACRNVVMYFLPDQARKVVSRLRHCLVDGGWLLGTPTEGTYLTESGLTPVCFPGAVLYRKAASQPAAAANGRQPMVSSRPPSGDPAAVRSASMGPAQRPASVASIATARNRDTHAPATRPPAPKRAGPDAAAAVFERALEDHRQGRDADAAATLERLAAEHPDRAEVYDLLTRVHADQGKLAAALTWSDRAIAVDKLDPQHHYLRATILQELGQWEPAAAALQRALYLDPDFVLAHFALGSVARRQGQASSARRHFANALDLLAACPPDAIVPASEGVTAGRLREIVAAMAAQETVV